MSKTGNGSRVTVGCAGCGQLNRLDLARAADMPRCGRCRERIALDRPVPVSDQTLERVVRDAEVPVLVDFYADWCGPCKVMAPTLDALARDRLGEILVAKLDTDRNPMAPSRFAIRGIPTLVAFRHGREVAREVGAVPRARLDALIAMARGSGTPA